jgi:S-DNA-T family DNA segregation ATPase FtsK/SpoIIIE
MTRVGVKNIDGYNSKHKKHMPYIIVIVDEMSDLMLIAGKEIENYIQRLSQMARAAGIHIIMATQRPSVDVITGTIKANFPTRISFQVSSKIDSRTILGEQGAEQLLGKGDMLFMSAANRIVRIHGPYVSESEIEKVNGYLRSQGKPDYIDEITVITDSAINSNENIDSERDELFDKAVDIIKTEGKASTSFLQRKLQIGYNRAARIMEAMEKKGIVGQANHVGKREIL